MSIMKQDILNKFMEDGDVTTRHRWLMMLQTKENL